MINNQFETLGNLLDIKETDRPGADSLYAVGKVEGVARSLSFILFEEIVESSPVQSRDTVFDPEKYPEDRELLESIKKHGITQPVVVRVIGNDADLNDLALGKNPGERELALVAGHRRVAAGKAAGLKGTEGVLARSSEDHEMITWAENMGRRELSSYEKALALKSLQERRGLSIRKTAEVSGISKTVVSRLFSASNSPDALQDLWKEGLISSHAVVELKEHWGQFEIIKDAALLDKIRGLSRVDARGLRDQLSAGTELAAALMAMGGLDPVGKDRVFKGQVGNDPDEMNKPQSGKKRTANNSKEQLVDNKDRPAKTAEIKTSSSKNSPVSDSQISGKFISNQKEALITAIRDVFPNLSLSQGKALFDYAIVGAVGETDVIWAAALYLAKGGNLDKAIKLASKAMSKPRIKSLLNREVKQMKQVSSTLKMIGKKDKELTSFLQKIFTGS